MGGGFAPRFAVEAVFLILLAVGAGFANLRAVVIVALMGGGWLLVSLIEVFAWRASTQTALRVSSLPQRAEPQPEWSVDEILVPESELESGEAEPAAEPEASAEEAEPEAAAGEAEPEEPGLTTVLPAEPEPEAAEE